MLRKLFAILLAAVLLFSSFPAAAEGQAAEEKEDLLQEYTEEAESTDRYFNVPVRIGIISSVNIRKDGLGIVFQPIAGTAARMALKTFVFITDLKTIELILEDGRSLEVPAVVSVLDNEAGTFIELNVTLSGAKAVAELLKNKTPVKTISFIRNSQPRVDMTVEELNQALGAVTGGAVNLSNQAAEAVSVFWKNLSEGAGTFAADARSAAEGAIGKAGDFVTEKWDSAEKAASDAAGKVSGKVQDALDAARGFFRKAAVFFSGLWNRITGK